MADDTATGTEQGQQETAGTEQGQQTAETTKTFTQADVDRRVTEAIKTNEEKVAARVKAEYDQRLADEKLKAEGKYDELIAQIQQREESEKLTRRTYGFLKEKGLTHVADVFDHDTSTFEGRQKVAEFIDAQIKAGIEAGVAEKLKTPETPGSNTPPEEKPLVEMSAEEFAAWKKAKGIQ